MIIAFDIQFLSTLKYSKTNISQRSLVLDGYAWLNFPLRSGIRRLPSHCNFPFEFQQYIKCIPRKVSHTSFVT